MNKTEKEISCLVPVIKNIVENFKTADTDNYKSIFINKLTKCEKSLIKKFDEKTLKLFEEYKNLLTQHLLKVRDFDCFNLSIRMLTMKITNKNKEEQN